MDPMLGMIFSVPWVWAPYNYQLCQGQTLVINQYQALYSLMGVVFGGNGTTEFKLPNLQGRAPIGTGTLGATHFTLGNAGGVQSVNLSQANMPIHNHTATSSGGGSGTATGTVTLPVTGTVSGMTISTSSTLTATTSGSVTIAAGAPATATVGQPTAGAVLAKPAAGTVNIYTTTSAANTAIGPAQTFTGPVAGTISATASGGTLAGSASGNVTLSVSGGGGGVVIGNTGGSQPFSTQSPYLALSFIIAVNGLYPDRP